MIRETVRAQLPLKIVDLSLIFARVFRAWQKLQPNRVQFQSAQPKHPLQRHRKIPTALEIFRRKTAAEEHCHPENKQKKHRTSNTDRRISNSETTFCIRHWPPARRGIRLREMLDARHGVARPTAAAG